MTAIAIWRFDEPNTPPFIWAAGDSRISGGGLPLIDDGVKLFSLPVACYGPTGVLGPIIHTHSIGYSFAGHTLMGQNAYLALVPLLTNLMIVVPNQLPTFNDIASFVCNYLKRTFADFSLVAAGHAMFEVSLFGFCCVTQQLCVCHLRPTRNETTGIYDVVTVSNAPMEHGDILCLGDKSQQIREEALAGFADPAQPGSSPGRVPTRVIERYIADQTCPTIAGRLQLGIADRSGFRGMSIVRPLVVGQPEAEMTYLGRRVWEDLNSVGPAIIALPGMS